MFIDSKLQLSDSQALTASANSTNVIDLGADLDIGSGEPMALVFNVEVSADSTTGDETYTFTVQTDDNEAFSTAEVIMSKAIPAAQLTAGTVFAIPLPLKNERFLRVAYVLAGTTPSVTLSAYLAPQSFIQNFKAYPDGFYIA